MALLVQNMKKRLKYRNFLKREKSIKNIPYRVKTDVILPLECTLYVQMKPFWKLLRILGLLPYFEKPETGDGTIILEHALNN